MHCRAILNTAAIWKFSNVRNECSQSNNFMAIQLVIRESPVCFARSLRTNHTFYLKARSFSFKVWQKKTQVAHWQPIFLVTLATSELQFRVPVSCNGVVCLCGGQILTKLEAETTRLWGYALRPGCSSQLFLNKRRNKCEWPPLITSNLCFLCFMNKCWPRQSMIVFCRKIFHATLSQSRRQFMSF